jgi:hypothetical protein
VKTVRRQDRHEIDFVVVDLQLGHAHECPLEGVLDIGQSIFLSQIERGDQWHTGAPALERTLHPRGDPRQHVADLPSSWHSAKASLLVRNGDPVGHFLAQRCPF